MDLGGSSRQASPTTLQGSIPAYHTGTLLLKVPIYVISWSPPVSAKSKTAVMEPPEGGFITTVICVAGRAPPRHTSFRLGTPRYRVGRRLKNSSGRRSLSAISASSLPRPGQSWSSILYRALFSAVKTAVSQYSRELGFCRLCRILKCARGRSSTSPSLLL